VIESSVSEVYDLLGDYFFQSDYMANEKTKRSWPAVAHVLTYTIPFAGAMALKLLPWSWVALATICVTHFFIDRFRLARYVCYVKNFLAPRGWWYPWAECNGTGYHKDRPPWMTVWLLIITDNTMHLIINYFALKYLVLVRLG